MQKLDDRGCRIYSVWLLKWDQQNKDHLPRNLIIMDYQNTVRNFDVTNNAGYSIIHN